MNKHIVKLASIISFGLFSLNLSAQNLPQNILDTLNNQANLGVARLSDMEYSPNIQIGHPAEYLLDGNSDTWYGLTNMASQGWVRLVFEEEVYLEGIRVNGIIPDDVLISLETTRDMESVTFPAGYIVDAGTDYLLDLSRERLISDNVLIRISGSDLSKIQINEIELITRPENGELHKKDLVPREMTYSKKELNDNYTMVDGKIGTVWHNQNRGFGSMIYWLYQNVIQGQFHSNDKWRKVDEIIYDVTNPGYMETLKFYLTDSASGTLKLDILTGEEWQPVGNYQLSGMQGWQNLSLEEYGEIGALKLTMEDPSKPWQPGNYGGIGEIELWGRTNPERLYLKDLISPAAPYGNHDALFSLPDYGTRDFSFEIVTAGANVEAPQVFLNGYNLNDVRCQEYDGFDVWEVDAPDHLLKEIDNSLKLEPSFDTRILSAHLISPENRGLLISEGSLSDGRRYSGRATSVDPMLIELLDGQAEMEEIILYFNEQAPGNLYIQDGGTDHYLNPITDSNGERSYGGREFLEKLGLDGLFDLQEIEVKGSRNQIVNPYIELLFPLQDVELPQHVTYHYKVIGITDVPDGEITVNGIPAQVRDNFFWVEMRDLNIREAGENLIEAKVKHPNGNEAVDKALIHIESDSNNITIDQEDRLYTTIDPTFRISGRISGYERDLRINGVPLSVPNHRRFSYDFPLDMGLNLIEIELMSLDGDRVLVRQMRQAYRQEAEPSLSIIFPTDSSMTNKDFIDVSGTVSPWGLESLTVNGFDAAINNGTFFLDSLPLDDVIKPIRVQATYETGVVVEKTVWVEKDQQAPVISDVAPAPGTMVGDSHVEITGTVSEENDVTVFVNGIVAPVTGNWFSLVVPLPLGGNNEIRISAQDEAGNHTDWPVFMIYKDIFGPLPFDVTVTPATWTNDRRPVIEFQTTDADIGLRDYAVSVNGGDFVTQESPNMLPYLPDGKIEITVRAYDLFGNWTDSTAYAFIDTTPPDEPENFRVVPGKDRVLLRWEETDEETQAYVIGQVGSEEAITVTRDDFLSQEEGVLFFEKAIERLEPGQTYEFYIKAVDWAGNVGRTYVKSITTSEVTVDLESNGTSLLEYDGLVLYIPQGSLPDVVDKVLMREIEDEIISDQSVFPLVSPIYSFSVGNDEGEEEDHVVFDKPYVGQITYKESPDWGDISEQRLAVYYYDDEWCRWFITDQNIVDPETNTITFMTDHFTDFSVQPTSQDEIEYNQLKGIEYPLTSESITHTPISVSAQGGGASTAMTEFSLPGKNGLDLVLRRTYSSTVADSDCANLPMNSIGLSDTAYLETSNTELSVNPITGLIQETPTSSAENNARQVLDEYLSNSTELIKSWSSSLHRQAMYKRGELSYALGQGWRLDFPYVRFQNASVNIYIPEYGFISTEELKRVGKNNTGNITYTDSLEGKCEVTLIRKKITNTESNSQHSTRYKLTNIHVYTKDGKHYEFLNTGQISQISDQYKIGEEKANQISFKYNDEDLTLRRIVDTMDRSIFFTYYDEEEYSKFLPVIKHIAVFDKIQAPDSDVLILTNEQAENSDFFVTYNYDIDQEDSAGLPLLLNSEDVQGRIWSYEYGEMYLKSKYKNDSMKDNDGKQISFYPNKTKSRFIYPLISMEGPGIGHERISYGKAWTVDENGFSSLNIENSYRAIGNKYELMDSTEILAVHKVETLDETGYIQKTTDYSYSIDKEGWIRQTTKIDGRLKEIFNFSQIKFKIDQPNTSSLFGLIRHTNIFDIKNVMQTSKKTYLPRNEDYVLTQQKSTAYYTYQRLPRTETTIYGPNLDSPSLKTSYTYDGWGNPTEIVTEEMNKYYTSKEMVYNWYSQDQEDPEGLTKTDSPEEVGSSELNGRIRDRLLRSYRSVTTTGEVERVELPEERVYQYNAEGSLIAQAERIGRDLVSAGNPKWSITLYGYNDHGELIKITNPREHITKIDYDYSHGDYDLVTTEELNVPDEMGNEALRTSYVQKDKLCGWVTKEIRADGLEITYERDNLGRIVKLIKPKDDEEMENPVIHVDYDDQAMAVKQIDPHKNYNLYSFNDRGELIDISKYNKSDEKLQKTSLEQDYFGNISQVTIHKENGQSKILNYSYDGLGRITNENYREEGQERNVAYSYYPENNTTVRIDENKNKRINYEARPGLVLETDELSESNYLLRTVRNYYNVRGDLLVSIDGEGNRTEYFYDRQGNLYKTLTPEATFYPDGETSVTSRIVSSKEYNVLGLVSEERTNLLDGTLVNRKTYEYDNLGRLSEEIVYYSNEEASIEHYYDDLDREVRTVDARDKEWRKEYTVRGMIEKEISPAPLENVTSYTYDLKDRLKTITDARENSDRYEDYNGTLTYIYDELDRLIKGELPTRAGEDNRNIVFEYDREGNLRSRTEPDGGVTTYTYTEQNRVKTETVKDDLADAPVSYTTEYKYDPVGNLIEKTLPDNVIEIYHYDDLYRKIQDELPEGVKISYAYDDNDNLRKVVNGRGFEQFYSYDSLNRPILYTDETGENWVTGYNALGNVTRTIDPNDVLRRNLFDERGSLIKEFDGRGLTRSYTYDAMGNLDNMTDARGTIIDYTYREDNLPVQVDYMNGLSTRTLNYEYDEEGALIRATDNGIVTEYNNFDGYRPDPMGKITRRTTTGYNDVSYYYDKMDRMTSLTNGTDSTISYEYNRVGQLKAIPGFMSSINYDDRGRMVGYTLDNGLSMGRSYDDKSRLEYLSYSHNNLSLKNYQYSWDKTDNLIEENGTIYAYDARDRLAMAMFSMEMDNQKETEVDLDDYGNTNYFSKAENDVIGTGTLEEVDPTLSDEFRLDWGARSLGVDMGYPYYVGKIVLNVTDGISSRISEDTVVLYTAMSNRNGAYVECPVSDYFVELEDGVGTITLTLKNPVVARYVKINSLFNERDSTYKAFDNSTLGLDDIKPLTVYKLEGGAHNEFYVYDDKGNRTRKTLMETTMETSVYIYYDNSDWLMADGTYGYKYDENGNLIEKGTNYIVSDDSVTIARSGECWVYTYDLRNRLEKVEIWDETSQALTTRASYVYDTDGYRIEKRIGEGTDEVITNYVFDLSGNMIEETENGVSTQYVFMGNSHIAKINNNGTHEYFGTNHLGSTTLLIAQDGTPIINDETNPFGDHENKNIFYTGKQWDEDAQLYYFNARWYDADTGRFITEDPVRDGLLWYAYANNNPMKFTDPTGMRLSDPSGPLDDHDRGVNTNPGSSKKAESSSGSGSNYFGSGSKPGTNTGNDDHDSKVPMSTPQEYDVIPKIQTVNTGNIITDVLLGGLAGLFNTASTAINMVPNTFGAVDRGLTIVDDAIPDEYSLTGMGLKEDLIAAGVASMVLAPELALAKTNTRLLLGKGEIPGAYLGTKAPKQVTPGTRTLNGQYVNDRGRVEPWTAHYDEYGRNIARTDFNAGNKTQGIPDTHYHTYEWGPGKTPLETGSHIPGEYKP